jgi:hypothetical protein
MNSDENSIFNTPLTVKQGHITFLNDRWATDTERRSQHVYGIREEENPDHRENEFDFVQTVEKGVVVNRIMEIVTDFPIPGLDAGNTVNLMGGGCPTPWDVENDDATIQEFVDSLIDLSDVTKPDNFEVLKKRNPAATKAFEKLSFAVYELRFQLGKLIPESTEEDRKLIDETIRWHVNALLEDSKDTREAYQSFLRSRDPHPVVVETLLSGDEFREKIRKDHGSIEGEIYITASSLNLLNLKYPIVDDGIIIHPPGENDPDNEEKSS